MKKRRKVVNQLERQTLSEKPGDQVCGQQDGESMKLGRHMRTQETFGFGGWRWKPGNSADRQEEAKMATNKEGG